MNDYPTEPCRSCGAPVIWAVTLGARSMPVNAEPVSDGNVALEERAGMVPLARVLSVTARFGRTDLRTSHLATCKQAKLWRTRGAHVRE